MESFAASKALTEDYLDIYLKNHYFSILLTKEITLLEREVCKMDRTFRLQNDSCEALNVFKFIRYS